MDFLSSMLFGPAMLRPAGKPKDVRNGWTAREGAYNHLLQGDGFFISYNPDTSAMGVADWTGDGETPAETALCKDGDYKILNGDFRASYEKLVPKGYDACLKFYQQQSAHADSKWSGR